MVSREISLRSSILLRGRFYFLRKNLVRETKKSVHLLYFLAKRRTQSDVYAAFVYCFSTNLSQANQLQLVAQLELNLRATSLSVVV